MTTPVECLKPLVLHLCGSRASAYYDELSTYYAKACFETCVKQPTYRHAIARVHTDGTWSFPDDFSVESLDTAKHVSMADAMRCITEMAPVAVNPIMFCLPGMTTYRTLFEALGVPMIGCSGYAMALSTNKSQTKAVMASVGVPVPKGELLRPGDRPSIPPPFILKPCREDNSMGITLFRGNEGDDLDAALDKAFSFDSEVLCEQYIDLGRELRVSVLEKDDGTLEMLPILEYFFEGLDQPIRTSNTKLKHDKSGMPTVPNSTQFRKYCSDAEISPKLRAKLFHACKLAHKAIGARDYSLYDVRVDPHGNPHFLESCLYCSFSPTSVVVGMAEQRGQSHQNLFEYLVERTRSRRARAADAGSEQQFGMSCVA